MLPTLTLEDFPRPEQITLDDFSLPDDCSLSLEGLQPSSSVAHYGGLSDETSRQVWRILHDMRLAATQRDHALQVARAEWRKSLRPLILISAQKDGGTPEHCIRVGALAALIARAMNQPLSWCDILFDAAALHDIGKLSVPDSILAQTGLLAEHEQSIFKAHPIAGARFLGATNTPPLKLAAEIALNHHENWDGSGYPAGRRGADIPLAARITSVADFIDCMSWPTDGTGALSAEETFRLLEAAMSAQFDPEVVEAAQQIRPLLERVHCLAKAHASRLCSGSNYGSWWREVCGVKIN